MKGGWYAGLRNLCEEGVEAEGMCNAGNFTIFYGAENVAR